MRSIFSRGPIVFTFTLFGLGNAYDTYKTLSFIFNEISFIKVKRYLTASLWGPVLTLRRDTKCRVVRVDRWDDMDGSHFGPLSFFVLRYIKHQLHIYLNIMQSCPNKFLEGFEIWTSWGSGEKNSKTPTRGDFFLIILKFIHKISPLLERPFCK